jgi:hypothetical protein
MHHPIRFFCHLLAGAMLAACGLQAAAADTQPWFTEGPLTVEWFGRNPWDGAYALAGVYCVRFPAASNVTDYTEGFGNRNAVSFLRVTYNNRMAAYVVTSTLPAGITAEEELANLQRSEQANARAVGERLAVTAVQAPLGQAIGLRMTNIVESSPAGIFPVERPLLANAEPLISMSVHRLFTRGPDRFEVAVLGVPDNPADPQASAQLERKLTEMADAVLVSLQTCTQRLPIRLPSE